LIGLDLTFFEKRRKFQLICFKKKREKKKKKKKEKKRSVIGRRIVSQNKEK